MIHAGRACIKSALKLRVQIVSIPQTRNNEGLASAAKEKVAAVSLAGAHSMIGRVE